MRLCSICAAYLSYRADAAAKIITQCGASEGYAYYFDGSLIDPKDAGWQKDGVEDGGFQLVADDDGSDPDLILTDIIGTRRSAKGDGANVSHIPGSQPGFYQVLTVYPGSGTLEHYLFHLDAAGNGTVVRGTMRSDGVIQKAASLAANAALPFCPPPGDEPVTQPPPPLRGAS